MAFVSGLLLASLYGVAALILQNQPLWLCVYSTLALAGLTAFGLGLSADIRADVTVLLPSLVSGQFEPWFQSGHTCVRCLAPPLRQRATDSL